MRKTQSRMPELVPKLGLACLCVWCVWCGMPRLVMLSMLDKFARYGMRFFDTMSCRAATPFSSYPLLCK